MSNRVAVYGTLKRGYGANSMLADATCLGRGTTVPSYQMTDVGFPMIEPDDDGHRIRVEVYDEPNWKVLDRYEGVPSLYQRRIVPVELDSGETVEAYIYEATNISGSPVEPSDGVLEWGASRGY